MAGNGQFNDYTDHLFLFRLNDHQLAELLFALIGIPRHTNLLCSFRASLLFVKERKLKLFFIKKQMNEL